MADPVLSFNLYRYPPNTRYVARGETGAPAELTSSPVPSATGVAYNWQGYGLDRWAVPVRVGSAGHVIGFSASMEVSGVCDWQVSIQFKDRGEAQRFYNEVRRPGTICSWHLAEEGEADEGAQFLSANFSSFVGFDAGSRIPRLVDNADPAGVVPAWVHRGGSGVVEDVDLKGSSDGQHVVTVGATCWGKQLQQTVVANVPDELRNRLEFRSLLMRLFYHQSEYTPALVRDLDTEAGETEADRFAAVLGRGPAYRHGDGMSLEFSTGKFSQTGTYSGHSPVGASAFSASRKSVTPVGKWLLVPLATQAAVNYTNDRNWELIVESGQQSLLRECQRLAEQMGLVFFTNLPYIIWQAPGARGTRVWDVDRMGAYQYSVRHLTPQSTVWIGSHADDLGIETDGETTSGSGRNIKMYFVDTASVDDYGEIQTTFLSSAPRYLNDANPPFPKGEQQTGVEPLATDVQLEANPWWYSDRQTEELMLQQAFALAVSETENFTANLDMPYRMGLRYGSDWRLGDLVQLRAGGEDLTDSPLVVRRAGISVNAQGEVRQQCVLGGRASIQPQWFASRLEGGVVGVVPSR